MVPAANNFLASYMRLAGTYTFGHNVRGDSFTDYRRKMLLTPVNCSIESEKRCLDLLKGTAVSLSNSKVKFDLQCHLCSHYNHALNHVRFSFRTVAYRSIVSMCELSDSIKRLTTVCRHARL
jgi:hypothetical protein